MCNTLRAQDFFTSLHLTLFERPAGNGLPDRLLGNEEGSGKKVSRFPPAPGFMVHPRISGSRKIP
jgi:hypothetical protein